MFAGGILLVTAAAFVAIAIDSPVAPLLTGIAAAGLLLVRAALTRSRRT
ncbi:MAG: hypothetical protein ABJB03_00355 [Rhodoglobus sp.]